MDTQPNNKKRMQTQLGWRDVVYIIVLVVSVTLAFGKRSTDIEYLKNDVDELKAGKEKSDDIQHLILIEIAKINENIKNINEKLPSKKDGI